MTVIQKDIPWDDTSVRESRIETVKDHGAEPDILRIIEVAEPQKDDLVLDLVTGLGHVARALAPYVKRVDAIDPDGAILKGAEVLVENEHCTNIKLVGGSPYELPFKDGTYDIVTARMALRHLGNPMNVISEARRVLKPSGRLIIADSLAPPQPDLQAFLKNLFSNIDISHIRSFTLADLEDVLGIEDFDIEIIEIYPKHNDFNAWTKRYAINESTVRMTTMVLLSASDRAKRHFRIQEENGKIISFVTWMILIKAIPAASGDL
ncbi:MAG: class I SAM-dependent methyltransferase [bacterium]|nr:class I SAM-dependent methyltransferase [bacterium]